MYRRLQSTFLSILSSSSVSTLVFVTHGYGLQVLTEYMSPETLVTSTDFACITQAEAVRTGRAAVPPAKPRWDHAKLVPDPLPCEWDFDCQLLCDVTHWKEEKRIEEEETEDKSRQLANPLPESDGEVAERKQTGG